MCRHVFVSDTGHNRVIVYDAAGKQLYVIGDERCKATGESLLLNPHGLALSPDGTQLSVADTGHHVVQVCIASVCCPRC